MGKVKFLIFFPELPILAAALLVLLAAAAGAGIVTTHRRFLHKDPRAAEFLRDLVAALYRQHIVPLFKAVQPARLCVQHVAIQLLRQDLE